LVSPSVATVQFPCGVHGNLPRKAGWRIPIVGYCKEEVLWRNLNWFFRKHFLHIGHGRRPGLPGFMDELCSSHGQRSFKPQLSLPASIEGVPGKAPVGLTSLPRHVYEKNNEQSNDSVAITAPELKNIWLLLPKLKMSVSWPKSMIFMRMDMTGSAIKASFLMICASGLLTRVGGFSPWAWLCGLAPILNGEGMGENNLYLRPNLAPYRVALLRNVAPHPRSISIILIHMRNSNILEFNYGNIDTRAKFKYPGI
jgi:hypothetical protein